VSNFTSQNASFELKFNASETQDVYDIRKVSTKSKVAFLTNIGHEIRTPLNGVLGIASLLKLTELDPTQKRYVETIESSSEALLGVLSSLLEFAQIEAGAIEITSATVQVDALPASAFETIRAAADAKRIELKSELGEGAVTRRKGDRERIVQILSYLLSNAVKFTQSGSVTLSVCRVGSDTDGLMRLSVSDTGIGMTEEDLNAVLRGVSSPLSSESSLRGAGLGLLIAQKLAALMGGRISGSSELGVGSRFSLEIPMGPDLSVQDSSPNLDSTALAGLRILLVEDNSTNGLLIGAFLGRLGADVTPLTDIRQTLDAVVRGRFDIVLLDLRMPVVDGILATRAIRDHEQHGRQIPIVGVFTGLSELDRWACCQSGMNDFIMRPLRPEDVCETIVRCMNPRAGASLSLGRPA
jgi:CheY-like chemotaxis protein